MSASAKMPMHGGKKVRTEDHQLLGNSITDVLEQVLNLLPKATVNGVEVVTIPTSEIRILSEVVGREFALSILNTVTALTANIAAEIADGVKNLYPDIITKIR